MPCRVLFPSVEGYSDGMVAGVENVGGLVGFVTKVGALSNTVKGYSTCSVEGDKRVGGLIGILEAAESLDSYHVGVIKGKEDVGGLVGVVGEGDMHGYSRSSLVRSAGALRTLGLIVGREFAILGDQAVLRGYYSATEGLILNGVNDPPQTLSLTDVTGKHGTSITMNSGVTREAFEFEFDKGIWKWEGNGKWPSIDFGSQ